MAEYHKDYLYISERTVLHMSFIESFGFPDDYSEVSDKLKGDLTIEVTTSGGRDYTISMNLQRGLSLPSQFVTDNQILREMIYRKWLFINRKV